MRAGPVSLLRRLEWKNLVLLVLLSHLLSTLMVQAGEEDNTQLGSRQVAFSPDGKTLLTINNKVRLWSVADWRLLTTLPGGERGPGSGQFSPNSAYVVLGEGAAGFPQLWNLK